MIETTTATYQREFASFWAKNFAGKSCPALPKSIEDLSLTEREVMREEAPILFQNLFRSSYADMPADVASRLRENRLWSEDVKVLEQYGWQHKANEMKAEIKEAERMLMDKKIADSQKRQQIQKQQQEAFAQLPLGHPLKQPSPELVARTREQWGISGRPSWELPTSKGQD